MSAWTGLPPTPERDGNYMLKDVCSSYETIAHWNGQYKIWALPGHRGVRDPAAIADLWTLRGPVALVTEAAETFQARVHEWMMACFGPTIILDRIERNHRFLEEAIELAQANCCTKSEALQLVEYVYGRPEGDVRQEIGGVMVTLAALCNATGMSATDAADAELSRVWTKIDQIRAKQAAKPKHSPLPVARNPEIAAGLALHDAGTWRRACEAMRVNALILAEFVFDPTARAALKAGIEALPVPDYCPPDPGTKVTT